MDHFRSHWNVRPLCLCRRDLQCGIHIWMLTGDKLETAISIGLSTKLLSPEMHYVTVKETDSHKIREEMQHHIEYGRVVLMALGGLPPHVGVLTALNQLFP